MKKFLLPLSISLLLTLAGCAVNYFYYLENTWLWLAYRMFGGEITVEFGFGWMARHIYAMSMEDTTTYSLRFAPLNFLLCWLILFALVYAVIFLAEKILRR